MPISDAAFLTLDDAKRWMQANMRDAAKDGLLEDLINAACAACEAFLQRTVLLRPYVELRDGCGEDFVYLKNAPASKVEVWIDGSRVFDDRTKLIDAADDPIRGQFFVPDDGDRIELLDGRLPHGRGVVRVAYEGGWKRDEIPQNIRTAALLTLQQLHTLAPAGKGMLGFAAVSAQQGGSVAPIATIELTRAIPKQARELLAPYAETGLGF